MSRKGRRKLQSDDDEVLVDSNWINSYSDMISLLFALFALLYGMSKINEGKFRMLAEALSRSLSTGGLATTVVNIDRSTLEAIDGGSDQNSNLPPMLEALIPVAEKRPDEDDGGKEEDGIAELVAVQEKIEKVLEKHGVKDKVVMKLEERGLIVSMLTDKLMFVIGEAELTASAREILSAIAPVLKECRNNIRIEGHTCNIPINTGRFRSNWELSTMRATNVAYYLITSQSLNPERVSILGYGEHNPLYANDTDLNKARNRRVDIVIVNTSRKKLEPVRKSGGVLNGRQDEKPEKTPSAVERPGSSPSPVKGVQVQGAGKGSDSSVKPAAVKPASVKSSMVPRGDGKSDNGENRTEGEGEKKPESGENRVPVGRRR